MSPNTQQESLSRTQAKCAFCDRPKDDMRKLIGEGKLKIDNVEYPVFICNECVELCLDVLVDAKLPIRIASKSMSIQGI